MPKDPVTPPRPQPAEPEKPPVTDPQPYKDPVAPPPRDPQDDRPMRDPVEPDADRPRSCSSRGPVQKSDKQWSLRLRGSTAARRGMLRELRCEMLTVWGRRSSFNLQKVMWLVGELGLEHRHIEAGGQFGGLDAPEFRAMNPHGRVPVIDDDGMIVWESHAILRYLAARHDRG